MRGVNMYVCRWNDLQTSCVFPVSFCIANYKLFAQIQRGSRPHLILAISIIFASHHNSSKFTYHNSIRHSESSDCCISVYLRIIYFTYTSCSLIHSNILINTVIGQEWGRPSIQGFKRQKSLRNRKRHKAIQNKYT